MLTTAVRAFLARNQIGPCHLLLAASGGVDSTAALLAMLPLIQEGFRLSVAHINHGLRGDASASDESFVRLLCEEQGLPIHVRQGELAPNRVKAVGVEAAARERRYTLLEEIRQQTGAQWVVTAHQRNDQAETVLMRLLTTNAPASLRGIRPITSQAVIRPFLDVDREQMERLLRERGMQARSDGMNEDRRYLRSRIRHELLPLLETYNERVVEHLVSVAESNALVGDLVEKLVEEASAAAVQRHHDHCLIDPQRLPQSVELRTALLLAEIRRLDPDSREVSASDLRRIDRELPTLKRVSLTRHLEILRKGDQLVIRRRLRPPQPFALAIEGGQSVNLPFGGGDFLLSGPFLISDRQPQTLTDEARTRQMFQIANGPSGSSKFLIRSPRAGDRFQPLGMLHEKKLSEFLINRKIPFDRRGSLPLLLWNDRIVWIPGVEVSEDFRVRDPGLPLFEAAVRPNDAHARSDIQPDPDR